VLVGAGFLISLIILHLITMRIADFVVDSRIGPLDRTLGFIFGVARGALIAVVAVIFLLWLIPGGQQPWLQDSRSLPILRNFGDSLIAMLPPDLEKQVTDILQRGRGGDEDALPDEAPTPPDDSTDLPEDGSVPATNT
jgi:membrane protein required for colicin V production